MFATQNIVKRYILFPFKKELIFSRIRFLRFLFTTDVIPRSVQSKGYIFYY
ncbi:hypothetical protein LPE509_00766 [Legionella pneumophila subsp. pneumophila LPE509]|nr:hypothetical protein LPE509_00766 [Legionella pneumophila subsp. pneumophila LPE509]